MASAMLLFARQCAAGTSSSAPALNHALRSFARRIGTTGGAQQAEPQRAEVADHHHHADNASPQRQTQAGGQQRWRRELGIIRTDWT